MRFYFKRTYVQRLRDEIERNLGVGVVLREAWQALIGPLVYAWQAEKTPPSLSLSLFRCHLTTPLFHFFFLILGASLSPLLLLPLPCVSRPNEAHKKKKNKTSSSIFSRHQASPSSPSSLSLFSFISSSRVTEHRASARAPGRERTTPPRTAVTPEQGKNTGKDARTLRGS